MAILLTVKKFIKAQKVILRQFVIFISFIAILLLMATYVGKTYKKQNLLIIRQSVQRAAVECYSVEGIYPPDISYLEENYSVSYDKSRYFVHYDAFASNVMPSVEVYERK